MTNALKRARVDVPVDVPKPTATWDQSRTPHFDLQKVNKLFDNWPCSNAYAQYMFVETGDERKDWMSQSHSPSLGHNSEVAVARSCHGYMHYTPILGGWISSLRHTDQKSVNDPVTNEASLWYVKKFLLGKYSPWAALLPYLTIVYNQEKVPVAYIVDGTLEQKDQIDKHLLQNFNIASRWPREFPGNVERMYNLWKTGLFKKTEALLLHNLLTYSPVNKTWTTLEGATVGGGHHFYHQDNCYRLLERKPNSKMAYPDVEAARFTNIRGAINSDNDRYVWGMPGGGNPNFGPTLESLFKKLTTATGLHVVTVFRSKLSLIREEDVTAFMKEFRSTYEAHFKKVGEKGGPGEKEDRPLPDSYVGSDSIHNYPGGDDDYDSSDDEEDF